MKLQNITIWIVSSLGQFQHDINGGNIHSLVNWNQRRAGNMISSSIQLIQVFIKIIMERWISKEVMNRKNAVDWLLCSGKRGKTNNLIAQVIVSTAMH